MNQVSAPYCSRCNYAFFTQREATAANINDEDTDYGPPPEWAAAPPSPSPTLAQGPAPAPAFAPVEAPAAGGPAEPRPAPTGRRGEPKPNKKRRFLGVPEGLDDRGLEALRYQAMRQSLVVVILLFVIGFVGPIVTGVLRFHSDLIGPVGIADTVMVGIFYGYARRVGRASKKPISPTEKLALARVKSGGWILALIPLAGSIFGQFGILFQTSPMHPIYYLIAFGGIVMTLLGVTTLKERYSYYHVFEFGLLLLLIHPLPAIVPLIGPVIVNLYWFQTTFLFLAVGFILMSFALRRMRAGQYEALESEMKRGNEALAGGRFDQAIARFDRAVTISHSLFSDKLFKSTRGGKRALPPDYYEPWVGKATALARSGRGPKALAILDLILEVDPQNAALWVNKGDILLSLNRPAEAYVAFEQAQRIQPQRSEAAQRKQAALDRLQRRME